MRNLKKVGCLILCLALMMSVAVFNVGAAFSDQKDIQHTEAVGMCTSLNIIGGYPDGSYKPAGNITRAEMCKMVCVALNGGNAPVLGTVTKHTFSDVQTNQNSAWAEPYIESCYTQGIVSGIGGGLFNPSGNITGSQAAKMLLVALGYQANKETFTGASWELNVNVRASNRGLYKELDTMNPSAALTRDSAAQMIWNALKANEVEYKTTLTTDANGQLVSTSTLQDKVVGSNNDKIDLMTDKYATVDTDYTTGTLSKFEYNSTKKEYTYTLAKIGDDAAYADKNEDSNGKAVPATYKTAADYTAMLGQRVCFVAKDKDNVYGAYAKDSKVVLTGKIGDIASMKDDNLTDLTTGDQASTEVKISGTKYKLDETIATTPVYKFQNGADYRTGTYEYDTANSKFKDVLQCSLFNVAGREVVWTDKTAATTTTIDDVTAYDAQNFTAVDKDGNGKIDYFMIAPTQVAKVSYVSSTSKFKVTPKQDAFNLLADQVSSTKEFKFDDVTAYTGLAKDDYVVYTAAKNTANDTDVFVKADKISGKITSVDDPDVIINGTTYTYDYNYQYNAPMTKSVTGTDTTYRVKMDTTPTTGSVVNAPKAGNTLSDAVVANGYIFDVSSSTKKNITDFAVVIGTATGGVNGNQAKLLFSDGTKQVVNTKENYFSGALTIADGTLVSYTTNSDKEYTLTKTDVLNAGFDVNQNAEKKNVNGTVTDVVNGVKVSDVSNSSTKVGYIATYDIPDTAVIFLNYESTSYKVVTGAQLKKMSTADFNQTYTQAFLAASKKTGSSNTYQVDMAYLSVTGTVKDGDSYYGYITGVSTTQNSDNKTVYQVKMATPAGEKTYLTDADNNTYANNLKKHYVVEFKLDSDGVITELVEQGAVGSGVYSLKVDSTAFVDDTSTTNGYGTIGITSIGDTLRFKTLGDTVEKTRTFTDKYFEIDSDTDYIYIENTDAKAADKTSISNAGDGTVANTLAPNALTIFDKDGKVLLIVYDVDNEIVE